MKRIGRYEIEAEIGRGAMGVVYLARDPRLQRDVAVKTYTVPTSCPPERSAEFRERFKREAQAAARLSHPGIVTVFDVDEDADLQQPFICMEYVPGSSLKHALEQRGRFELSRATEVAELLADALDVAHKAGVVHRDIKPANIILQAKDGAPKVADFGVARFSTSDLTQAGSTFGSPAYMAPEQIRGEIVDGRADLFSLAVVLYESLCGRHPFGGDDATAVSHSIVYEPPVRITRCDPDLPGGLDAFFERALAKEPARRFPDGAAFARALRVAVEGPAEGDPDVTEADARPVEDPRPPDAVLTDSGPLPVTMMAEEPVSSPGAIDGAGQRSSAHRRRIVGAAGVLLVLSVIGWILLGPSRESYLQLDGKSSVRSGTLSLQIDGNEVYSRELSSPYSKKNFIKKMFDQRHETFEAWIEVPSGKHEIAAVVVPRDEPGPFQDTIVVDLEPGETRRLRMVAGRSFGSLISLELD